MRQLHLSAAAAALALTASPVICCVDDGSGGDLLGGGQAPGENATTPAETAPSTEQTQPATAAAKPGKEKPTKESSARTPYVIWAAPGHETFAVGAMLRTTPQMAEALRAQGKARQASKEEVAAHKGVVADFG